jgi:hypothetical protein
MTYANGQAPFTALKLFEGHPASPDMYARLSVAIPRIRKRGAKITINQIYRFLGNGAKDYLIGFNDRSKDEDDAHLTSTGDGNQYYQQGRAANGSTPSAATPGFSNHGNWLIGAVDSDCSDPEIRAEEFEKVGLVDNISSESWHAAGINPFNGDVTPDTIPNLINEMREKSMLIPFTYISDEKNIARGLIGPGGAIIMPSDPTTVQSVADWQKVGIDDIVITGNNLNYYNAAWRAQLAAAAAGGIGDQH